jgi:hypothetical protein
LSGTEQPVPSAASASSGRMREILLMRLGRPACRNVDTLRRPVSCLREH